jgi:hypothetical protein
MGTLVKGARGRSKFWYYCYRDTNGRRLKKSTKETDRRKARIICEGFEESEYLAASQKLTGHASADMNIIYTHHELETIRSAIKTLPRLPKV